MLGKETDANPQSCGYNEKSWCSLWLSRWVGIGTSLTFISDRDKTVEFYFFSLIFLMLIFQKQWWKIRADAEKNYKNYLSAMENAL